MSHCSGKATTTLPVVSACRAECLEDGPVRSGDRSRPFGVPLNPDGKARTVGDGNRLDNSVGRYGLDGHAMAEAVQGLGVQ